MKKRHENRQMASFKNIYIFVQNEPISTTELKSYIWSFANKFPVIDTSTTRIIVVISRWRIRREQLTDLLQSSAFSFG